MPATVPPADARAEPGTALPFTDALRAAARWWEPRRITYNLGLAGLAIGWVVVTWPHFRPAFKLLNLGRILVLAALANVCYCAAYAVDVPMQYAVAPGAWRRGRRALWWVGTAFALLLAQYWIGDEIYPDVG
jgi:hypothetical protein